MLIATRAVQGVGAALMTPQTMAVITRTFPPDRRGAAMGLWGATAGVATLVGPLAGGLLVDGFGWEWIFFVNIPVGIIGFVLAWRPGARAGDPPAPLRHASASCSARSACSCIVFGLQEGEKYDWGVIWGPITVWSMIVAGVLVLGLFIWTAGEYQERAAGSARRSSRTATSRCRNLAIATVGFTVTSMSLPIMFYLQLARGLTPTQSALLLIPMAVLSGVLVPARRTHPRPHRPARAAGARACCWSPVAVLVRRR